jgi:hypothetical protein
MLYSLVKVTRCFGGIRALLVACLLHTGFLLGLLFDLEDGGDMFF